MAKKHSYSKKVRAIGYCALIIEVVAIVLWIAAWYGNGMTLYSIEQSITGGVAGGGSNIGFVNTTDGPTFSIPIKGGGFFPVTTNVEITLMDSQNQTLTDLQSSVTVFPGETKELTVTIPNSALSVAGQSLSNYNVLATFHIGSLLDMVGMRFGAELNLGTLANGGTLP